MSDDDDADPEAQRARPDEQPEEWRKEGEEWKARLAQLEVQREAWRKEREERDRRWKELMGAADREIDRIKAQNMALADRLKQRASALTIAGAAIGVALIWGASQTVGFWSLLMNALGTGLLVAATVAVAGYFVSQYWRVATEIPNEAIFDELKEVHLLLSHVSVATDSHRDVMQRLDFFLIQQEAEEQAERETLRKRSRERLETLWKRGYLPPKTGQVKQGENALSETGHENQDEDG